MLLSKLGTESIISIYTPSVGVRRTSGYSTAYRCCHFNPLASCVGETRIWPHAAVLRDVSPDDFVGRGFPVFRTGTSIAC